MREVKNSSAPQTGQRRSFSEWMRRVGVLASATYLIGDCLISFSSSL